MWQVLSVLIASLAVGCGQSFVSTDRVTRSDGTEICVTSVSNGNSQSERCGQVRIGTVDQTISVGDCVEARHAGESARLLGINRVVSCPAG
jgi:hypothetical protein